MNNGQVQSSNPNTFFGVKVSVPGVNVNNATPSQLLYSNNYSQELFYSNGYPQVLIGQRTANTANQIGTTQEGFFVAQSGVNVLNATDSELIFSSNVGQVLQVGNIVEGSITLSFSAQSSESAGNFQVSSTSTLTIPHYLGYEPIILPYAELSSGSYAPIANGSLIAYPQFPGLVYGNPYFNTNGYGLVEYSFLYWEISADTVNVYINGYQVGGGGNTSSGYSIPQMNFDAINCKVICLQSSIL